MNKFNAKQMVISLLIREAIAVVIAVIISFVLCREDLSKLSNVLLPFIIIAAVVAIIVWALHMAWGGSSKKAKETFEAGLASSGFTISSVFEGTDAYFAVDEVNKKIAYVSFRNSKEFQLADGSQLSEIKSDHIKAPMGGTSGVYFSFKYNGKTTKLYTYLTNANASLKSERVMEAIAKADYYAESLVKITGVA